MLAHRKKKNIASQVIKWNNEISVQCCEPNAEYGLISVMNDDQNVKEK